ncbi:hypothetical protein GRI62_08885 [Erythrobacter arachoides]|uniref:Uncharacterized protein n=1 Tax=Aurantiacibacter arachoides TaxID=1850444 RepID=A0A845A2B2_9SPHN|nr:hypothetical protein [Aurantiacibacter arachoides]MXO93720.1 hypothetical protein [Aurantiacibacter arachoides]GGD47155.1 hypothetical protein GCM10011411_03620 [Aurantiacibacter arachoides]
MPERQDPHSDKELIDNLTDVSPSQQSRAGGDVAKDVGTRGELNRATDPDNREPVVGSDNPADDEMKGPKTRAAIQSERNDS